MQVRNIPVIIVGGGPVGLSMALALARQNVDSLVIERHPSTSNHPKARGANIRTMELFRQWGNATELLKWELPKEARRIIWAKSLQGEEITRISMDDSNSDFDSPTQASLVAQDRIEESLYHSLLQYKGTEVHFLKECISFEQDTTGITSRILNLGNSREEFVRSQYLIAADGAHSRIRKQLGINMEGPDNLGQSCNVLCELDLSSWTKDRPFMGMLFTDPKIAGRLIAAVNGSNRWIVSMRAAANQTKEFFSNHYCTNEIRRVLGIPDLAVTIINKHFWTMASQIATEYRKDRVFLVGDAAHRLPPAGGFGMNTGIQDAHNLAWKVAWVINHRISAQLLDSYYVERAPIAEQNTTWSNKNARGYDEIIKAISANDMEKLKTTLQQQSGILNFKGLDLGFIYHSSAVLSENKEMLSMSAAKYSPTTLPGSRAPHVQLIKNNHTISTLDLFEKEFVLLVGSNGQSWQRAADELAQTLSIPLKHFRVAFNGELFDPAHSWHQIYEVSETGVVLVRPDGHVAWRCKEMVKEPKTTLEQVLSVVLHM